MAVALSPIFNGWQGFSSTGIVLAAGKINTYAAGTSTPLATYTTSSGSTPNTNPIILDAGGRPPQEIWLTVNVSYKFVLTDSLNNVIATYDNITAPELAGTTDTLRADLASTADVAKGDALIGVLSSLTGGVARTQHSKNADILSVKDFGAVGDGTGNDATAIAAAMTAAASQNGGLGSTVYFPPGTYNCTTGAIAVPNNVILAGDGQRSSIVYFRGAGDGFTSFNTVNGSTNARCGLRNIGVVTDNVSNVGAGFVDVGGHFVDLFNVHFYGFKYNVIFNQTEVGTIDRCLLENAITAEVWLVNGPDYPPYPTASQGYTNRITISRCAFNSVATAYCLVDDGGIVHSIVDNNFNGGLQHIRCAGTSVIAIDKNEFEQAAGPCVTFQSTTIAGTAVGQSSGISVDRNAFIPIAAQNAIQYIAAASASHTNNSFSNALSAVAAVSITNLTNFISWGNRDLNSISGTATYQIVKDVFNSVQMAMGVAFASSEVTQTYSASMTINALLGNIYVISVNNAAAMTINAPTTPTKGQRITIKVRNTSGGAMGAITWNAVFKMSAWTNPANGNSRSIDFDYDGTNWIQLIPNVDVPN